MAVTWVKWPPYGADSVIVVVYGVWVPSAQSGMHPWTMEVPVPWALLAPQSLQVMPVMT
jgi:hypothetical protein